MLKKRLAVNERKHFKISKTNIVNVIRLEHGVLVGGQLTLVGFQAPVDHPNNRDFGGSKSLDSIKHLAAAEDLNEKSEKATTCCQVQVSIGQLNRNQMLMPRWFG